MPDLNDGSATPPDTPRTPVRSVSRLQVKQASLKRSPRTSRSVSPALGVEKSPVSGGPDVITLDEDLDDTRPEVASSSTSRQVPLLQRNLKRSQTPPRVTTPRAPRDEIAAGLAAIAAETRAIEAEQRATASEGRIAAADAHVLATRIQAETLFRAAAAQAELTQSLVNAADLARQSVVGEAQVLTPAWPGSPDTMTFNPDPVVAPVTAADSALIQRLASLEAHMASMQQDAQESEAARLAEAAEYERVIRRQRESAETAQTVTDSLLEKVQEMHFQTWPGKRTPRQP
jgi:hypothetical protein